MDESLVPAHTRSPAPPNSSPPWPSSPVAAQPGTPAVTRPPRLTPHEYLDILEETSTRFAGIAEEGDLDALVPSCPDWTLADLVAHVGRIHQWAVHAVLVGDEDFHQIPPPIDRHGLADWYRENAGMLIRVLRDADPHAPAWVFGPPPGTVSFWYRRQAHEVTVHLWDAAASQGLEAPIEPVTALDGIDEVTEMFFPRQVTTGRIRPLDHSLALAIDGPGGTNRWVLAGDGTGPRSAGDAPADATVRGAAQDLLLLLWRRIAVNDERLTVVGDAAAARSVLSRAITP